LLDFIVNTSPLQYLQLLRQLELLRALAVRVWVPPAVVQELAVGRSLRSRSKTQTQASTLHRWRLEPSRSISVFKSRIQGTACHGPILMRSSSSLVADGDKRNRTRMGEVPKVVL
jgi:hypothetical protein